ncbi:MAG: type I-U CRISPR-associated helicase/endonuclease Cas3 [Acidobacteria bacterium]|nr:type I-U CRISPR-associated helicase/endonuclease Cas3 [Acidobacteriota bacterium]
MELRPDHFGDFFKAIHGHPPFPWQQRLLTRLAETDIWPDVLDLPTGTGKTAALDIAVFHLALRTDDPSRTAIRIALVVDRRLVVDAAHDRACAIASALRSDERRQPPVVAAVAARLRGLAGEREQPLVAARLRGGAPLEDIWTRSPSQPTVLCSTVDQVGSRLLFRGYGVSDRMKPIHAGHLGEASLILLDEAHLSEPFRQTVTAVRRIGRAGVNNVLLTATPGVAAKRPFRLSEEDRAHPKLCKRIRTAKPTRLIQAPKSVPESAFAQEAAAMMERLTQPSTPSPAIGVVVNRVALARAIFDALRTDPGRDAILMIGRARGVDRDLIAERLRPFITGAKGRKGAKPTFIVATQCLEVGVDLDLDGLVTQAASLDALRQRFGRLNRAGRSVETEGCILALPADIAKRADDPVYGDRIRNTWNALTDAATKTGLDFSSEVLDKMLGPIAASLSAPRPDAPVVMPAYLELWAQTAPVPACDPEIGLFLHGAEKAEADISVVWRDDLLEAEMRPQKDEGLAADEIGARLAWSPPRSGEMLQLRITEARRWLLTRANTARPEESPEMADAPQRSNEEEGRLPRGGSRTFRWAGRDDPRTAFVEPRQLRPGDVIVVPATYGGCDEFGWKPSCSAAVPDVGDKCALPYRARRYAVRLRSSRFGDDVGIWLRVSKVLAQSEDMGDQDLLDHLLDALRSEASLSEDESSSAGTIKSARRSLETLKGAKGALERVPYGIDPGDGMVLVAPRGVRDADPPNGLAPTTEQDSFSQGFGRPVSLDCHGRHVANLTRDMANALRFESGTASDLQLAAWLHDAGKADPRFQVFLSGGGNPWNVPDAADQVLAKSGRPTAPGAWSRSGLPDRWRHEALSVQMARAHPEFASANDPALVLWLIGTHHGRGRPFFGFTDANPQRPLPALGLSAGAIDTEAPGPHSPAFDFEGFDWPALAEDLRKRYGVWRLALYEAVIRLADHRASEREKEATA